MPDTKDPKWGAMKSGKTHMSDEWTPMEPSDPRMSDKWDDMEPSAGHMSDKWVEQETDGESNPKWNEMKQERRDDPYAMRPSAGDREIGTVSMKKVKPDNKVERANQHTEFGSTREI